MAQQPAAALQGQQIQNKQQQQALDLDTYNAALRYISQGLDPATAKPDDIFSGQANFMKANPTANPSSVNAAADVILNRDPKTFEPSIRGGIAKAQNMLTPLDAGLVTVTDPNTGQPRTMTRQQANTLAVGGGAPPGAPAASLPGFTSGPSLGAGESSQVMQADLAREGNFSSEIYPLQKALDLAQTLGPGGMAPGSKGRQEFESYVYGLMPQLVPAGMQDKIKNYAELEKYLTNNLQNRAQNLGPHTNEGLATAATGAPNVNINDLAGVDLIKSQIMVRRMEHAQVLNAAAQGPANYTQNKTTAASGLDPRAFGIDMMSPQQIQNLHQSLRGAEREKFNTSYGIAQRTGVISPPGK